MDARKLLKMFGEATKGDTVEDEAEQIAKPETQIAGATTAPKKNVDVKVVAPKYDPEQMAIANKTGRVKGLIGSNPVVSRYVQANVDKGAKILDFGAGKFARQTTALREQGFNVDAYDFGSNNTENHISYPAAGAYDVVFASNVMNVQSSEAMLISTLKEVRSFLKDNSSNLICNFPPDPCKIEPKLPAGQQRKRFEAILSKLFSRVDKQGPVYICGK